MVFFERLSHFLCRRLYLPVLLWPALAVVLVMALPSLHEAADESQLANLGERADHALAGKMIQEGFPGQTFYCSAAVLFERPTGLEERDHRFIVAFAGYLASKEAPEEIHSVFSSADPVVGEKFRSRDGQAETVVVNLNTGFIAEATKAVLRNLRAKLQKEAPEGLNTFISGEAAVGADYGTAAHESLHRTTAVTLVLVITILLIIYRSPITPLVPLATVAISFFITRSIAIMLALAGLPVPEMMQTFLIVILFGAGTDYCLFLASRYREELTRTHDYTEAVRRTMISVGAAISASALTTVVGLGSMGFAEFRVFAATGPCLAIGIVVTLAVSLTFTPALLRLLGPKAYWPAQADKQRTASRFWRRVAARVCAAPVRTLLIIVALLAPFAVLGTRMKPSYDIISELPRWSPSVVGYHAFRKHYNEADLMPTTLLVRSDGDLRSPAGIETLQRLTEHIAEHPRVESIASITRPLGDPLDAVTLAAVKAYARRAENSPGGPGGLKGGAWAPLRRLAEWTGLDAAAKERLRMLKRGLDYYVSEDGAISRMMLSLKLQPYSREAVETLEVLRRRIKNFTRKNPVRITEFHFTGATARINDIRKLTSTDLTRIKVLVVLGVIGVLVLQFRWFFTALYLVATMILSYFATLGISMIVFIWILGEPGLDWKVQYFMFVLLIALGIDYNILIMSRIKEERKRGDGVSAIRRASIVTGAIITSCGVIMAGTFSSLMASRLAVMVQLGFAVAFGVLLDTFVVRLMMVPAIVVIADRVAARMKTPEAAAPEGSEDVSAPNGENESPPP